MADLYNNRQAFDEAAAASHQVEEETRIIWFENEDIQAADEPYLLPLLEESFASWRKDTDEQTLFVDGQLVLLDLNKNVIGSAGTIGIDRQAEAIAVARLAADTAHTSGTTEEEDRLAAVAVPVLTRSDRRPFCVLVYVTEQHMNNVQVKSVAQLSAMHFRTCFYRKFEQLYIKDLLLHQERTDKEASRRDALFLAAKRLYDQFDVTSVLSEMLSSLEQLYPDSIAQLYLSQDHVNGDSRVKPLVFKNAAHDLVAKSFLEGKLVTEQDREGTKRLAVPMTGKQAAYGVLCLTVNASSWDDADLPAFVLLADTAGTAFENAKLYEQSNLLINELRLINELTKRLNQSLKLKEIFKFASSELLSVFDADYCCVLQLNKEQNEFIVTASNIPAMSSEHFSPEYGFSGIVHRTKEPLIVSDYWHTRVVNSKLMDNTGARSLIATPILVDSEVVGVIMVAHKSANFFSYDNYKLLQVMSTHIGLAITNASLHAEVRRMVITDNLTGLHARHYLNEQIQSRQRKDPLGALILVDIDHFKQINDTFGHQVGDRILVQVSNIIRSSIRQGDIAARWGGEELAVYLPGIRSDQAYRIAERIRAHVESETEPVVTVSCGVSEWTFENEKISVESLFYRADMALYEAKNNGRNRIFVGQAN
jgi:diguanylate cyclase (GGDEF) domain